MKFKKLSFLLTMCAAMVIFTMTGCNKNTGGETESKPVTQQYDGYYSSLTVGIRGEQLKSELRELTLNNKTTTIPFNKSGTYMGRVNNTYKVTDAYPGMDGYVLGFYDNKPYQAEWNQGRIWQREHVWPDSRGGSLVENDVLVTRPCNSSINSSRNNKAFDTVTNSYCYDPGQYCSNYRGIAARIIFYCALIEPTLKLTENVYDTSLNMGKLSTLMNWNSSYLPNRNEGAPVELVVEQNRNDAAQTLQGNRNPFVDHPEFVNMIWGK